MAYIYSDASQLAPSPNRTIGCQTLLKDGACVHSGWLRRQSLRNKFKIFAWPQVYVVIAGGCVYCYSNEVSKRPASAFSLYGYDRVFRAGEVTEREATWTFKLVHVNPDYRSYLFSSSSEKEMGFWMKLLRQEMLRANGKLPRPEGDGGNSDVATYHDASSLDSAGSITSDDYMEIEANIYEDSSLCILPSNYTNKKEEDDSGDEMDRVVTTRPDLQERPPQPPPVPHRPDKRRRRAGVTHEDVGDEMDHVVTTRPDLQERPPQPPPVPDRSDKWRHGVGMTPNQSDKMRHGVGMTPEGAAVLSELKCLSVGNQLYKDATSSSPVETVEEIEESEPPEVDGTSKQLRKRSAPDGSSVKRNEERNDEEGNDEEPDPTEFWTSIFFHGDKDTASEIIRLIPEDGVYLVRVNDDKSMVLHVYANEQSRKYRIFKQDKKYTLKKESGEQFNQVEELVYFYYTNPLPGQDVCLSECYLYHPEYHKLTRS